MSRRSTRLESYAAFDAWLGKRTRRLLDSKATNVRRVDHNGTSLWDSAGWLGETDYRCIAVQYYSTDIVIFSEDGSFLVNFGGWFTRTTRDRITAYAPVRMESYGGCLYLGRRADWPRPGIPAPGRKPPGRWPGSKIYRLTPAQPWIGFDAGGHAFMPGLPYTLRRAQQADAQRAADGRQIRAMLRRAARLGMLPVIRRWLALQPDAPGKRQATAAELPLPPLPPPPAVANEPSPLFRRSLSLEETP